MELYIAQRKEKRILENLLQLYLHDISKHFPIDFDNSQGIYVYDKLDKYFDSSNNYAYFIKEDLNLLGFMLVDFSDNEIIVQEMFVLNHYKNKGVGTFSAKALFNKHKGNWVIKSLPCSEPSERFWDKTIKEYTNNNYVLERIGKYNRAVFKFSN